MRTGLIELEESPEAPVAQPTKELHRLLRSYGYILFAIVVLLMSWESNLASAALITSSIPEESIRIRILANSDSVQDQWIKKEIREAIVADINSWAASDQNIDEAREQVRRHIPAMERIVGELLARYSFAYGYKVELGLVEFPVKVFGGQTYPSGEYEALRITLGSGQGQNWWCVMFPPLCFGKTTVKAKTAEPVKIAAATHIEPVQNGADEKVEYRFFLAEVLAKLGSLL